MNNWVEQVKNSIPDHSEEVRNNLEKVINNSSLEEIDAHACAFVSAISAGNGELAFEISMNGPLMGTNEREVAKKASSVMAMSNISCYFANIYKGIKSENFITDDNIEELKSKFEIYALAASITNKCDYNIKKYTTLVSKQGFSDEQIQSIVDICAVVSAIGKIVL